MPVQKKCGNLLNAPRMYTLVIQKKATATDIPVTIQQGKILHQIPSEFNGGTVKHIC